MKWTKTVKGMMLFLTAMATAAVYSRGGIGPMAVEHVKDMVRNPDGKYAVTCDDDTQETVTADQIRKNQVCKQIRSIKGTWMLKEGGVTGQSRLCDLDIEVSKGSAGILSLVVAFAQPCSAVPVSTEQCAAWTCSFSVGGTSYSLEFKEKGVAILTRVEDGVQAVYKAAKRVLENVLETSELRIAELNGVEDVLQASQDQGQTWYSVCDYAFTKVAADVACKELGMTESDTLKNQITVTGDTDFGWTGVECQGSESKLSECSNYGWRYQYCGEANHIQLTCK